MRLGSCSAYRSPRSLWLFWAAAVVNEEISGRDPPRSESAAGPRLSGLNLHRAGGVQTSMSGTRSSRLPGAGEIDDEPGLVVMVA
jgi:hypothetical protein